MTAFTWKPNSDSRLSVKPQVMKAQFGDGYEQRVGDGINTQPRSWALSFSRLVAEIDQIEAFLSARSGTQAFDWKPPSGPVGRFVCSAWDRTVKPSVHTLTATFREVFEP